MYTMHYSFASETSVKKPKIFFWKPEMLPDILGFKKENNCSVSQPSVLESKWKIDMFVEDKKRQWHC